MKKLYYLIFPILFLSNVATAQTTKKSTLDTLKCGLVNQQYQEAIKNKKTEVIKRLRVLLFTNSNSVKKFDIKYDTLQIIKKIKWQNKVHYNITKIPLEKLIKVSLEESTITLYTKLKEIDVRRFDYKKLKTSQISFASRINDLKTKRLYLLFDEFITVNKLVENY